MHKEQFKKKNIGNRVLLEPNALPWDNSKKSYDDIWTIEDVLDNGVRIKNSRTDHNKLLGFDYISKYRTDPSKDYDGHTHGVLVLNVQLYINDREVIIKEKPRE